MTFRTRIVIIVVLCAAIGGVFVLKGMRSSSEVPSEPASGLPRLVELGSGTCMPCQMMASILEDLKKEYAGRLEVESIDVFAHPEARGTYGVDKIPTQVFFDASGERIDHHVGFLSKEDILARFKAKGVDLSKSVPPAFERLQPAKMDTRPREHVCTLCDGDIHPRTLVTVKTAKGDVRLCSVHCYFILYSCLTEDKTGFEKKVSVTDYDKGEMIPALEGIYLYGLDGKSGRPRVKVFADRTAAEKEQQASGGDIIGFGVLQEKELSHRCGFCDRACYPEDAAKVTVDGVQTWGCCSHCALGVAARTGKDIEVHERDRLTGESIVVKTLDGSVASLEPATAVAWFGQRQKADGSWGSAGCFHQGFFTSADNLKTWVEQNPYETGRLISIHQALADKMKLSPQQIQNACKIGECAPK